jgi:hypothetical protein
MPILNTSDALLKLLAVRISCFLHVTTISQDRMIPRGVDVSPGAPPNHQHHLNYPLLRTTEPLPCLRNILILTNMLRQTLTRSLRSSNRISTRSFSVAAVRMAEGDLGGTRRGGAASGYDCDL